MTPWCGVVFIILFIKTVDVLFDDTLFIIFCLKLLEVKAENGFKFSLKAKSKVRCFG